MNRRNFLAALTGFALDPERLLWRPGAKLISIPRASVTEWRGIDYGEADSPAPQYRTTSSWHPEMYFKQFDKLFALRNSAGLVEWRNLSDPYQIPHFLTTPANVLNSTVTP